MKLPALPDGYHAPVFGRLRTGNRQLRFLAAKEGPIGVHMLVWNPRNFTKTPDNNRAGWAMAGAVVVLMASLVYFTNGRSGHATPHGHEQHAAVHFQLHK